VLDRGVVVPTPDPQPPTTSSARLVQVRPGDSLWRIAARELGRRPSARDVSAAWPQWYRANADVIGPDPDLIRPGQQLRVPEAS
jgi:nucleoid-associated protein YgaU